MILSGGSGQRLWPISRKATPKQFCQFLNEPLLELTLKRLENFDAPLLISNINLKIPTENILNQLNFPVDVLYEPMAKNTAPAIALAAKYLLEKKHDDHWVCVFPADHIIENTAELVKNLNYISTQKEDAIYLLGIQPTEAKTGYGYIEVDTLQFDKACDVRRFHEKPDQSTALTYLKKDNFLWNSGIFIFKPKTLIHYFEETHSKIWQHIKNIDHFHNITEVYNKIPSNSFDYEVLENFHNIKCVPSRLKWSDVGTWDEFAKVIPQHESYKNELISINSKNNYFLASDKKAIATIGVKDLLVIDNPDSLLICKKGNSEAVKSVVQNIKNEAVTTLNNFELKPWGYFKVLLEEDFHKVKKICVYPNQQLSYQSHQNRNECWVITKGSAEVTLENEKMKLSKGQSIYINKNQKHRIANIGDEHLVFIEVQTGSYFGEDDITRFEDDYGRI